MIPWTCCPVILFVRMWVEMCPRSFSHLFPLSSSSWGCELKFSSLVVSVACSCHPLREDVSWNIWHSRQHAFCPVILFVRMWVEISHWTNNLIPLASSSSWGCELKYVNLTRYFQKGSHPLREDVSWNTHTSHLLSILLVILFVRMWVEMLIFVHTAFYGIGHPLREDVSWNDSMPPKDWQEASSSSWGCELKFHNKFFLTTV